MPRDPACRICAEKKVGCKPVPGAAACRRCLGRNLRCEWPSPFIPAPPGVGTQKTSCDRCRIKRVKCERQNAASTTCVACSVKGEACSLSMSILPLSAGVSQCPPGVPQRSPPHCADATPGTTPHVGVQSAREPSAATGSSSASRSAWLDTVLAPSPQ
ncbi:hypothetical protein VTO73DRAFT_10059 [Trametes versicolor]